MSFLFPTTAIFAKSKSPRVAIIGAGLAGLTAAYRLHNKGMHVDLYEARDRVGGRILTVNINGNIAELGAQNIADGGEALNLHHLISELRLELTECQVNIDHSYFNGKDFIPIKQLLKNKNFDPQILRNQLDELASKSANMKEILEGIIEESDPLYTIMAVRLAAYEGASIEKLSPLYVDTLFHMLSGGICSAHKGNEEEEYYVNFVTIKGGNSLLAEKIAKTLGNRLHLNNPLTQVAKNKEGSFLLSFANGQKEKADILILALPCSAYQEIIFEENVIPLDRLNAIKSVHYGTNAKIVVPLDDTSKIRGVMNAQIVCFFGSKNLLTIYYTGETSSFTDNTILHTYKKAWPMVETGFENARFVNPVLAQDRAFTLYNGPVGYSWPNDPYAKGSYSYISAGQENLLTSLTKEKGEQFKTLFSPIEHRLYFAGEHASILMEVPGTMEAACESGERVARAILRGYY